MLTVAPTGLVGYRHRGSLEGSTDAFRRHRRIIDRARQDGHELFAAETAKYVGRPHVGAATDANRLSVSSPIAWPKRSLILLKLSRSNTSTLTGSRRFANRSMSSFARGHESAPVQHAGQLVDRRRILMDANRALLRQHQHDEGGADDVEHDLEREDRDPSAGQRNDPVVIRQHAGERNRAQEHQPCSIGTKIAGQRRSRCLRRSRQSSVAVRNVYVDTMNELSTIRAMVEWTNSGTRQAVSQIVAPTIIAPHSTGRPWNSRAALQIMPQATNSIALAVPAGSGGEIWLSMLQMTTDTPPTR